MKTLVHIIFNPGRENWDITNRLLLDVEVNTYKQDNKVTGIYSLTLEKGDERIQKLLGELKGRKLDENPITREEYIYTKKEIESAELLVLYIKTYCGDGYNVYGTEFDTSNICSVCGTGEVQKSDLIINKTKMGEKDIAITYNNEFIISDRLAGIFRKNNLTGFELRIVHHYTKKMRNEPKLFQIIPTCTLPPLMAPSKLVKSTDYCSVCGKKCLVILSPFYYKKIDLKKAKIYDFNKTTEFFGLKLTRRIPTPALIISQKTYQTLKKNKIKNIKVEPAHIIQ